MTADDWAGPHHDAAAAVVVKLISCSLCAIASMRHFAIALDIEAMESSQAQASAGPRHQHMLNVPLNRSPSLLFRPAALCCSARHRRRGHLLHVLRRPAVPRSGRQPRQKGRHQRQQQRWQRQEWQWECEGQEGSGWPHHQHQRHAALHGQVVPSARLSCKGALMSPAS